MNLRIYLTGFIAGLTLLLSPVAQVLTFDVPSQYPAIQLALDAAKIPHTNGEPVLIRVAPGLYRESIRWQSSSNAAVTIEATGAVLSGSDAATYTALGSGLYSVQWPYNWALSTIPKGWESVTVPLELRHREALWYKDSANIEHPLLLSLSCDNLQLNRFCIDITAKRLVFRLSSEPTTVEVAMRETCAILSGDNLVIRGLTVEHCASDLDKAGTNITGRNVTLEDMVFRQNVSGGLNTSNTTNLTTRRMLFADNGLTGWGGSLNTGLRSTDDTALWNNWRGFKYGWVGWNVAGLKHLRLTDAIYTNLSLRDNQAHSGWWDFLNSDVTLHNFESRGNLGAGAYIEANPGAFTIRQAIIVNNALGNAYAGIFATNSTNVTLDGVYVENTGRPALFIGGEQCRPAGDGCLPVASNWHIHNSTFISTHSALQFAPGYGLDLWLKTLDADFNTYAGRIQPFLYPSPYNRKDLPGHKAMLVAAGNPQDQNSRDSVIIATATPSLMPTQISTPSLTPAPIVPTATVTPDATVTPVSLIIEFNISGRAEIRIIQP